MTDSLSRLVLRVFKVPPEPHLPAGAPESARVFRAGANFWRLKVLGWSLRQALTLAGFVMAMVMLSQAAESGRLPMSRGPLPVGFLSWVALVRSFEIIA